MCWYVFVIDRCFQFLLFVVHAAAHVGPEKLMTKLEGGGGRAFRPLGEVCSGFQQLLNSTGNWMTGQWPLGFRSFQK